MFLTLLVLTPVFYFLPKFCLASVVISSVITLVQLSDARELWRVKKADCFLWVFAFFATLFLGVEEGIAAAVGVSLVIVIYESVRPQISILWRLPGTEIYRNVKQENCGEFVKGVLIVRIGASMYFANVAYIRDIIFQYIREYSAINEVKYVVVEMTAVISIDSTAIHILEGLVKDLRMRKIMLAFTTVGNRVEKVCTATDRLLWLAGWLRGWALARSEDVCRHSTSAAALCAAAEPSRASAAPARVLITPSPAPAALPSATAPQTMKLAHLYELIGKDWFHSRVHDAVLHCLQHELTEMEPIGQNAFLLPVAENSLLESSARARAEPALNPVVPGEGRSEDDTSEDESVLTPGSRAITHPV